MPPKFSILDNRNVSAGLAALGVIALVLSGILSLTTPGEQKCRAELSNVRVQAVEQSSQCRVDLADARARLEILTQTKEACRSALDSITGRKP